MAVLFPMLLINPPVVRICEPPPGIVKLASFLRERNVECRILDAGLEGILDIFQSPSIKTLTSLPSETWSRRAVKGVDRNLALLKSERGYTNFDRYSRAVNDLQKALSIMGRGTVSSRPGIKIGLANYEDEHYSPLSAAELAGAAEDFRANPFYTYYKKRIPEVLADFNCEVIGLSINFLSQVVCAFALIGYLRDAYPHKKIILGGGLVTSWIRQGIIPEEHNFGGLVDGMLPGRGEETLMGWLGLKDESAGQSDKRIDRNSSGTLHLPPFDELPLDSYLSPGRTLPWNLTSGCAWRRCTFCPEKAEGTCFYSEPLKRGIEALGDMSSILRPALIHLTDNEIPPAFLKELIRRPPGAGWYGFCRFNSLLEDPGFCRDLAASGCVMLQLGLESGEQSVLDALAKGTRVENNIKILENLKVAGIGTFVYLLFGTPAEDLRAARKTLALVQSNIDLMDFLNLAIFNLPISSELASELDTNEFYAGDLSLYSEFVHPGGWNRGDVRRFLSGEFMADPKVRKTVNATPPVFTSNHAPFLLKAVSPVP
ncbi:MAG: hypothetical protein JEY99_01295 [Spirochaetales bacterium]|nr:hypothetical protein [Spirochaetales bacterium]